MRRRSRWPSKMIPKRSKASRSNQFAELQISVSETMAGTSSSGQKTLRRRRQLLDRQSGVVAQEQRRIVVVGGADRQGQLAEGALKLLHPVAEPGRERCLQWIEGAHASAGDR